MGMEILEEKFEERLEGKTAKKVRRESLQTILLTTVRTAGVLSVALLAPNALRGLAKLGILKTKRQREYIGRARERLLHVGLLTRNERGLLRLTPKGEARLRLLESNKYKLPRPKRWDKRWRVLIFDIPEPRKNTRDKVRRTLLSIGFKRLQDSVWVYPFDCENLITLLKADFKIGKDLLYLIVEHMEYDRSLREYFGLARQ